MPNSLAPTRPRTSFRCGALRVRFVEIAATAQGDAKVAADAKVADLAGKRTAAETALRDAEAKANYQSALSLVVPAVLQESICDISVRAELLNIDRNVVLPAPPLLARFGPGPRPGVMLRKYDTEFKREFKKCQQQHGSCG